MSVFDDEVREGTREILVEAGDPASFAALNADPVPVTVMLDRDVERTVAGMQGVIMEARTELTGYTSELGAGARGDVVTLNGRVGGWPKRPATTATW
ncbi:hypothetical protein HORIV_35240 [Vreelandella olivaria]|uniref:Uncharacterized protein n=1 Tax=Vreelandella olivaria TaxID=390919 RepID=A0ABM7GKE5_9GAMM|nr:hypothetical protein HORIV_35240 [Halomonas olivaria]